MKNIFIIFLVIILIVIIIIIKKIFIDEKYGGIPKKIWTYWDDESKIPKSVKMCMEGWKKFNPTYEIILLTKKNFEKYVKIPKSISSHPNFNDMPQRFADLIRIWVLAENGGVWIDSTTILRKSLNEMFTKNNIEYYGYYIDQFTNKKNFPVIENWFFACTKNSKFIKLWRDEFSNISKYSSVEKYINSRKDMNVDFQGIYIPNYLAMHISVQKILQIDKYSLKTIMLEKAEDGPFKYLVDTNWDAKKAFKLACNNSKYNNFMKLRGHERKILEENFEEFSNENCGWTN